MGREVTLAYWKYFIHFQLKAELFLLSNKNELESVNVTQLLYSSKYAFSSTSVTLIALYNDWLRIQMLVSRDWLIWIMM